MFLSISGSFQWILSACGIIKVHFIFKGFQGFSKGYYKRFWRHFRSFQGVSRTSQVYEIGIGL